jgi:hypothetical protein
VQSLDGHLTAKAYLIACETVPGASVAEADKLEQELDGGHEAHLIAPAFRRMVKGIRGFRRTAPISRLGGYCDDAGDAALARVGASRQSLFLAAARSIAATQPEIFGTMSKPNEFADGIKHCLAERVRLYAEISKGWNAGDVLIERDRVSFRMSNGVVTVSENLAENLVNFCLTEMAEAA